MKFQISNHPPGGSKAHSETQRITPAVAPELQASFAYCRVLTRHYAKSFYFASAGLPAAKRDGAYAVYAFCRYADDLLDEQEEPSVEGKSRYRDDLRRLLTDLYEGKGAVPFGAAFRHTVHRYGIAPSLFIELIEGVCMDLGPVRIGDFEELDLYCYRVASVVGLMMSRIFGLRDPAGEVNAVALGTAMQLTNILRDVREDLAKDRVYLPAEELQRFALSEKDLRLGQVDDRWRDFMRFQIARARSYYAQGEAGIPMLDGDGSRLTVRLMSRVYAAILDEIERADYDVFSRRAYVSLPRKLWVGLGCLPACIYG